MKRTPSERLAVAVIARAIQDTTLTEAKRKRIKDDAEAFLAGGPMLTFWARIAGLDPAWIVKEWARLQTTPEELCARLGL